MSKGSRHEKDTVCPATVCPYLGLTDGSPWTGETEGKCETGCGWYQEDHCLAGKEHDMDTWRVEGPTPPKDMWPECPYADECQWQQQRGDSPCAPRRKLLFGVGIEGVMINE